tara:strand:- start:13254 stop:14585 length:1332 start_codon:yes stop_codon:yes gene_type:complete
MSRIGLIVKREYYTRVRKKSFILMSFLGPLIVVGFLAFTIYINKSANSSYEILVVDEAQIFEGKLRNNDKYHLKWAPKDKSYEQVKEIFKSDEDLDLLLYMPVNLIKTNSMTAKCLYKNIPSTGAQKHLSSIINEAIELYRVESNDIKIETYRSIKTRVNLDVIDVENQFNKNIQRKAIVGSIFALLIYIFIFMYSIQVMKGVIEEKTNRIIEIIMSSVSSFQLMIAKIIGVGLVGLTQFTIWIIVIFTISTTLLSSNFPDLYSATFQVEKINLNEISNTQNPLEKSEVAEIIQFILYQVNWPSMFLFFIIYFVFGYLLYGGLMAAVGAAVDEETDTQQFLIPITIPLIFSLTMIGQVIDNPSSSLSFWLSEIPFTSPIIMMVRIAMGIGDSSVEIWEIILSLSIIILTFILTTKLSGKIYKKGILSFGKKASYGDLFKWLKS